MSLGGLFLLEVNKVLKPEFKTKPCSLSVLAETEDDEVVRTVQTMKNVPMKLDRVPALTDKTFDKACREPDIAVILFYFPCK